MWGHWKGNQSLPTTDIVFAKELTKLISGNFNFDNKVGYQAREVGVDKSLLTQLSYMDSHRLPNEKGGRYWESSNWIPESENFNEFLLSGPPSYNYSSILQSTVNEKYKFEILRFLKCLEIWDQIDCFKPYPASYYWQLCLKDKSSFAESLDDLFSYSVRKFLGKKTYSTEKTVKIDSYDSIFPYRFLLKWQEPDKEDYKNSLTNWDSNPDWLESFRSVTEDLLKEIPDNIPLIEDWEILVEESTTTSYNHRTNETFPHWEGRLKMNDWDQFKTDQVIGKRCLVPVYPSGTRDAVIVHRPCNNTIRWIERQLRHVLEYVPESAVCLHPSTFEIRKSNVLRERKGRVHILRDMKKCGLTHNSSQLFPILGSELKKKFPYMPWDRIDIYKSLRLVLDNGEVFPKRGYFLGMANHLVTLSLIVIYRMTVNYVCYMNPGNYTFSAIIGNDDCDIESDESISEEFIMAEKFIQEELGNWYNLKKSFLSNHGLFYEEYTHEKFKEKNALVCNALACAYWAPDIRVAKMYISSQSERFFTSFSQKQLGTVIDKWGYEFFPLEYLYSIHVGGWLDTRRNGCITTLIDIEEILNCRICDEQTLQKAYRVSGLTFQPPKVNHESNFGKFLNYEIHGIVTNKDIKSIIKSDEEFISFYKKLTSWQRNFTKKFKKIFRFRKYYKGSFWTIKDYIDNLVPKTKFLCLPDFAILESQDWGYTVDSYWDTRPEKPRDNATLRLLKLENNIIINPTPKYIQSTLYDLERDIPEFIPSLPKTTIAYDDLKASFYGGYGIASSREYYNRRKVFPKKVYVPPDFEPPYMTLDHIKKYNVQRSLMTYEKTLGSCKVSYYKVKKKKPNIYEEEDLFLRDQDSESPSLDEEKIQDVGHSENEEPITVIDNQEDSYEDPFGFEFDDDDLENHDHSEEVEDEEVKRQRDRQTILSRMNILGLGGEESILRNNLNIERTSTPSPDIFGDDDEDEVGGFSMFD